MSIKDSDDCIDHGIQLISQVCNLTVYSTRNAHCELSIP